MNDDKEELRLPSQADTDEYATSGGFRPVFPVDIEQRLDHIEVLENTVSANDAEITELRSQHCKTNDGQSVTVENNNNEVIRQRDLHSATALINQKRHKPSLPRQNDFMSTLLGFCVMGFGGAYIWSNGLPDSKGIASALDMVKEGGKMSGEMSLGTWAILGLASFALKSIGELTKSVNKLPARWSNL